jgi:predicted transcriptional regulator
MFTSKQEKERRVIDLYSQSKTYRQIAEEARVSPNDIHAILKKKEEEKNNSSSIVTNNQQQPSSSSLPTKAYELFSEGKRPVQVAITLNLREPEATKLYREYWKLKRLHKLNSIYEEIGDDIRYIIVLYRRAKKEGVGIEHIVKLLQLANEDNASGILKLERRSKWLIDKIHDLDRQIESKELLL